MDGSATDYVNWKTDPDKYYSCAVICIDKQYWQTFRCDVDWGAVVCQVPKCKYIPLSDNELSVHSILITAHPDTTMVSTTVSSPTPEPDVSGCSLFERKECKIDQEDVIIEIYESDSFSCQELCSGIYFNECKSFSFNSHSGLCTLKSSAVQSQDHCLKVGGSRSPPISSCWAKGCQVTFLISLFHSQPSLK